MWGKAFQSLDLFHHASQPLSAIPDGDFFHGEFAEMDGVDDVITMKNSAETALTYMSNLFEEPWVVPIYQQTRMQIFLA